MVRNVILSRAPQHGVPKDGAVFETEHRAYSMMHNHRHGPSFATLVLEGAYVEVRDSVAEVCRRGMLIVHDAREVHADRFAADTRCLNIELSEATGTYPCGKVALADSELRNAVGRVLRSFYRASWDLEKGVVRLQETLRSHAAQRPHEQPPWLRKVIEGFPWAEAVPIREASAMAGLHATHFSRAFRRHVGMTANEYRMRTRLRVASKLLLDTSESLARVSIGAGFSDQSHLTRAFTQQLGLAPGTYRRTFSR